MFNKIESKFYITKFNFQITLLRLSGGHSDPPCSWYWFEAVQICWLSLIVHASHLRLKASLFTYCLSSQAYCLNALVYLYLTKSEFWPTSSHWISTFYSSLESLQHKETDCIIFAMKFCINICTDALKGNFYILVFLE